MEPQLTKNGAAILRELVRAYDNLQDSSVRASGMSEANLALRVGIDPDGPNFDHFVTLERELLAREFVTSRFSGNLLPTPAGLDYGRGLLRPWWRNIFPVLGKVPKVIYWLAGFLASVLAIGRFLGFI